MKLFCLHSERKYGSDRAEMVYSPVMHGFVCPICGHRSKILTDEMFCREGIISVPIDTPTDDNEGD